MERTIHNRRSDPSLRGSCTLPYDWVRLKVRRNEHIVVSLEQELNFSPASDGDDDHGTAAGGDAVSAAVADLAAWPALQIHF